MWCPQGVEGIEIRANESADAHFEPPYSLSLPMLAPPSILSTNPPFCLLHPHSLLFWRSSCTTLTTTSSFALSLHFSSLFFRSLYLYASRNFTFPPPSPPPPTALPLCNPCIYYFHVLSITLTPAPTVPTSVYRLQLSALPSRLTPISFLRSSYQPMTPPLPPLLFQDSYHYLFKPFLLLPTPEVTHRHQQSHDPCNAIFLLAFSRRFIQPLISTTPHFTHTLYLIGFSSFSPSMPPSREQSALHHLLLLSFQYLITSSFVLILLI